MSGNSKHLTIDGVHVHEGTSMYDTRYDRVLWITDIGDLDVKVEPVTAYELDEFVGWSLSGREKCITDRTAFSRAEFKALLLDGRFELGPRPRGPPANVRGDGRP